MKLPLASLTLVVLITTSPVTAAEPIELERQFISGLRSRGLAHLALEYLEGLEARAKTDPKLAAEVSKFLPMEKARTRVVLARTAPLEKRADEYRDARAELEKFVKDNEGKPDAVQAEIEVARIVALQGKVQLSTAARQESREARLQEAVKARQFFTDADTKLARAIQLLDAQMVKYKGSDKKEDEEALEALKRDKLQARFDRGINVLLQSQTYIFNVNDNDALTRGKLAEDAEKILDEVAQEDPKNPLARMAAVWRIPCALFHDQPKSALERCDRLRKNPPSSRKKNAEDDNLDARMLAQAWHLSLILKDTRYKTNPLAQIKKEGLLWLKDKNLARFGTTPEGYGVWLQVTPDFAWYIPSSAADVKQAVQFNVAVVAYSEAMVIKKKTPRSQRAVTLLKEAQKQLTVLEESDSDLSQEARSLNQEVYFALTGGKPAPTRAKTFKDHYLQSQSERRKFQTAREGPERKKALAGMARALNQAIDSADTKVPRKDLVKAGTELVDVYLNLEDPHRAALLGEYLVRHHPPSKETALAAAYALEAYVRILGLDEELAETAQKEDDPMRPWLTADVVKHIKQGDRDRFLALARHVEKLSSRGQPWENEGSVGQYARYQHALLALREKNFPEAIELLEAMKSTWPGYAVAQCQLVFAALGLTEDDATRPEAARLVGFRLHYPVSLTDEEKAKYQERALAALKKLPPLTEQSNTLTFHFYFAARLKQCKILYKEKKYEDLEKLAGDLLKQFSDPKLKDVAAKLDQGVRDNLQLGMETWQAYAQVGQTELAYSKGDFDEVLKKTAASVKRVDDAVTALETARQKQDKKAEEEQAGKLKDFPILRDMLELALHASVQKGNRAPARKILTLLQKMASETHLTGTPTGIKPTEILTRLVLKLREKVQELRDKKDQAALAKTVATFTEFLDELTTGPNLELFIKQLDEMAGADDKKKSKKASILLLLARSYASLDNHKQAATLLARIPAPKDDSAGLKNFLEAQILFAEELRKARDFKKAKAVLEQLVKKASAGKTLDMVLLGMQAQKELIMLDEEQEEYAQASKLWGNFMKERRLRGMLANRNFETILDRFKDGAGKMLNAKLQVAKTDEQKKQAQAEYDREVSRTRDALRNMYQEVEKLFFDCYYHKTYCIYKYAQKKTKTAQARDQFTRIAASNIHKLKVQADKDRTFRGWKVIGKQFEDLLKEEPPLMQEYRKLRKSSR
jgi:hypothetical protein